MEWRLGLIGCVLLRETLYNPILYFFLEIVNHCNSVNVDKLQNHIISCLV